MKVTKTFYCTQEKKTYYPGDEYKGSRKDLGSFLQAPKAKSKSKAKKS